MPKLKRGLTTEAIQKFLIDLEDEIFDDSDFDCSPLDYNVPKRGAPHIRRFPYDPPAAKEVCLTNLKQYGDLMMSEYRVAPVYSDSHASFTIQCLMMARDFVTRTIVWVGRYLSHCSSKAVANSWFLSKQNVISNNIPLKIKMERLTFKLEIVKVLSASPPTNKSILTVDEDNSVVIPLTKRSKHYNPPATHVMVFILAIPG
ncbi:uncharacterized protein TNCV_2515041 [Trichonephila clavipes]|nr:uncharacterized protein TNCV_2515041 [Trichonephila clavipes]